MSETLQVRFGNPELAAWSAAICLAFLSGMATCAAESAAETGTFVVVAPAQESGRGEAAPSGEDAVKNRETGDSEPLDLAVLLDEHMTLIRLDVRHDGRPFGELWRKFMEQKFDVADKDQSGTLDAAELSAIKALLRPAAGSESPQVRNARQRFLRRQGQDNRNTIVDLPDDPDAERELTAGVTRDEFLEFVRKPGNGPIKISGDFQPSPGSRVLFARLDLDHDGKLSESECGRAFETLQPLDLDEVELFSREQLMEASRQREGNEPQQNANRVRLAVKQLQFSSTGPAMAWADRVRQHFSPVSTRPNFVEPLRRTATLYDDSTFAAADADGDGSLDREELSHLMRRPIANLELAINLTSKSSVAATAVHLADAYRWEPPQPSKPGETARLTTGSEQVQVATTDFVTPGNDEQANQLVENLKQFDQDNNDYLEERELRQFGNLANFKEYDTDGDGKIFFDELRRYVAAQTEAASVRLAITITDQDHALFEALDTNGDGRLGRRELNRMASMAKTWDRNGD
ncbi:MAG TPA: EF-hand domain-containing protein, partial [Pirellulales bacterium]|nr:EF-hand domain-containing protein [Pirellulales bacterium]